MARYVPKIEKESSLLAVSLFNQDHPVAIAAQIANFRTTSKFNDQMDGLMRELNAANLQTHSPSL